MQREAALAKSIHSEAYRELISRLTDARVASGLTQQALADRLGRPQSYVAKVEGLERRLDVVELFLFSGALGWDPMPSLQKTWENLQSAGT